MPPTSERLQMIETSRVSTPEKAPRTRVKRSLRLRQGTRALCHKNRTPLAAVATFGSIQLDCLRMEAQRPDSLAVHFIYHPENASFRNGCPQLYSAYAR